MRAEVAPSLPLLPAATYASPSPAAPPSITATMPPGMTTACPLGRREAAREPGRGMA
jgi:hypothetical protein